MSALCGIFHRDGMPVPSEIVRHMVERLVHRGPDGNGTWHLNFVGMGHCQLWTTPESQHEQLPEQMGDLVITADARIDNRADLIHQLRLSETSSPVTDSQIILQCYQKWAEHCTEHLIGDFSFAIWDQQKQQLFCARDPFGHKPFYYYSSPSLFAFASEIKALFCLPQVPRQLNEAKIADLLMHNFERYAETCYQNIHQLHAAHVLLVTPSRLRSWRYWDLDPTKEVRFATDDDYTEAFLELFTEAVRCRLRSAFPIGSMLSGGLDSSSIACVASTLLQQRTSAASLHTYTAVFPHLPEPQLRVADERTYVNSVLAMADFHAHFIHGKLISPLTDIDRTLWYHDEPHMAPNLYLHQAYYATAAQENVRVLLDGIDGDTTVSHGLSYLTELGRRGRWVRLYREASAVARRASERQTTKRILWRYGVRPILPDGMVHAWHRIRGISSSTETFPPHINRNFAQRISLAQQQQNAPIDGDYPASVARKAHAQGLRSTMIPEGLTLLNQVAVPASVDPRYPFFDRRLVEFCLALPAEQKLRQGWTRFILRKAMEGILPSDVQWRFTKANLSPNFILMLTDKDRPMLEEAVVDSASLLEPFINITALRCSYERFIANPMKTYRQDGLPLYEIAVLARWLRTL